ncbi:MAG: outer membrane lipoprotein-sorting protein [Thiogranum sp.]
MIKKLSARLLAATALLLHLTMTVLAADTGTSDASVGAASLDGNAILRAVDRKMRPESYEIYRKLINVKPDGSRREFVMYTIKKGRDRVANLFLAPAYEQGRVLLRLGENMWLYLPDVNLQPIRVASLQSVVGGIFSNWDLMHLELADEYDVESAQEEADTYLLSLKAKTRLTPYDRLKVRAGRDSLLLERIDAYASSGLLIKSLHFKDTKDFGDGIVRPAIIETKSPLWEGYKAVMVFAQMRKREFPDEVFTLSYMSRIGDLR